MAKQYTSWLLGTGTVAHLDPPLLKAFSQRSGGISLWKPTRLIREPSRERETKRAMPLSLLALGLQFRQHWSYRHKGLRTW